MNYINFLHKVAERLKSALQGVTIKLTPWQSYAGQGYDKLSSGVIVLINLGDIYYHTEYGAVENKTFAVAQIESEVNINLSVGKRNLGDEDDFSIEEVVQKIVEVLTSNDFEGVGLIPKTISTGVIDDSLNYWRHLTFSITIRKRIGG